MDAYWAYHISRYKIVSRIFYIALDKPLILKIRKNIAIKGVWKWAYFSRGYYLHTVVILGLYVHTTYGTRYFRPNMLVSSLGNLSPLSATNGLHIGFTFVLTVFPFAALRVVLPTPRQDSNLHYQDKYQRPYYRNYIFNCTWRFYRGYQTPAIFKWG